MEKKKLTIKLRTTLCNKVEFKKGDYEIKFIYKTFFKKYVIS